MKKSFLHFSTCLFCSAHLLGSSEYLPIRPGYQLKSKFSLKPTDENGPHVKSAFSALQWTGSRGPGNMYRKW